MQEEEQDWIELAIVYFTKAVLWTKEYSILLILMLMAVALLTHSVFITSLVAMCFVYVSLYIESTLFIWYYNIEDQKSVPDKERWIRTSFFFKALWFTSSKYKNNWEAYLQFVCDTAETINEIEDVEKLDSSLCYYIYCAHYLGCKLLLHWAWHIILLHCIWLPLFLLFVYMVYGLIHLCMQVWNYLFKLCSMAVVWFSVVLILACICYVLWDMYHKKFMSRYCIYWAWHFLHCIWLPLFLLFVYMVYGLIHLCMQVWNYLFKLCSMAVVWFSVVLILACICYALWDMYHKKFMSLHNALLLMVAILALWSNFRYSLGQEQVEKYIDDISHEFHTCNGKVIHFTPKNRTFPRNDTCTTKEMDDRYYAYWDKEQPNHFYTNDPLVFDDMLMLFSSGYLTYPNGLRLPPRIVNDQIPMASNDPDPVLPMQCVENKPEKPLFTERLDTHECAATGALDARNRTIPQHPPPLWSWLLKPQTVQYIIREIFDDLLDAQYTMQEWNWTDFASWDDNKTKMAQHWTNLAQYMDAAMDSIQVPVSDKWVNFVHTYLCSYDKCMPQITHKVFDVAEENIKRVSEEVKNVGNYTAGFNLKAMRAAMKEAG